MDSPLGDVILNGGSLVIEDAFASTTDVDYHPVARRNELRSILTVPVSFSDETQGALSIYRQPARAFSKGDERDLAAWATFVPVVLETLRDQLGYKLLAAVSDSLGNAEITLSRQTPLVNAVEYDKHFCSALEECAHSAADILQSLEVSIFLKMPHHGSDNFECVASTIRQDLTQTEYAGSRREGLTGWILNTAKPLRLLDLLSMDCGDSRSGSAFDELCWKNSARIDILLKRYFQLDPDAESPPLGFVGAPILWGESTVGMIRCSGLKAGLNYYGSRELSLLGQVALLVARFWRYYFNRLETVLQVNSLQGLAEGLNRTNLVVQRLLETDNPDPKDLFPTCLDLLANAIPEATGFDVRMIGPNGDLEYAAISGSLWTKEPEELLSSRLQSTFNISNPDESAGAWVIRERNVFFSAYPAQPIASGETFPSVKGFVSAPILQDGLPIGVVDVHVTEIASLPERIPLIAQLATQQLALYRNLLAVTGKRRALELQRTEEARQQIQMLQDISHQLRSPINQAHLRVQSALRYDRIDEFLKTELLKIRGLCGKAKRVTTSVKLFAALARNEKLEADLKPISSDDLVRGVIEAASDYELLLGIKKVRFDVERRGFEAIAAKRFRADFALLMQAVDCLVDNAAKYSYPGTTCRLIASVTGTERASISILNRGVPLRSREAKRCTERAWRSEEAWSITGEGSGIGLWLVDNIMMAHRGEVLCLPTNADGWTEFKLVFPFR
jgi:signal transduction histidine kinase